MLWGSLLFNAALDFLNRQVQLLQERGKSRVVVQALE
jgi:hypothetical protein